MPNHSTPTRGPFCRLDANVSSLRRSSRSAAKAASVSITNQYQLHCTDDNDSSPDESISNATETHRSKRRVKAMHGYSHTDKENDKANHNDDDEDFLFSDNDNDILLSDHDNDKLLPFDDDAETSSPKVRKRIRATNLPKSVGYAPGLPLKGLIKPVLKFETRSLKRSRRVIVVPGNPKPVDQLVDQFVDELAAPKASFITALSFDSAVKQLLVYVEESSDASELQTFLSNIRPPFGSGTILPAAAAKMISLPDFSVDDHNSPLVLAAISAAHDEENTLPTSSLSSSGLDASRNIEQDQLAGIENNATVVVSGAPTTAPPGWSSTTASDQLAGIENNATVVVSGAPTTAPPGWSSTTASLGCSSAVQTADAVLTTLPHMFCPSDSSRAGYFPSWDRRVDEIFHPYVDSMVKDFGLDAASFVTPSGSLAAPLLILWHYPTIKTTLVPKYGFVGDLSNCCMKSVATKLGIQTDEEMSDTIFHMEHIHLRLAPIAGRPLRKEPYDHLARSVIHLSASLKNELYEASHAKVALIMCRVNYNWYLSRPPSSYKIHKMSNVCMFAKPICFATEFGQDNRLRRIVFFSIHSEAFFYAQPAALVSHLDWIWNTAATLASRYCINEGFWTWRQLRVTGLHSLHPLKTNWRQHYLGAVFTTAMRMRRSEIVYGIAIPFDRFPDCILSYVFRESTFGDCTITDFFDQTSEKSAIFQFLSFNGHVIGRNAYLALEAAHPESGGKYLSKLGRAASEAKYGPGFQDMLARMGYEAVNEIHGPLTLHNLGRAGLERRWGPNPMMEFGKLGRAALAKKWEAEFGVDWGKSLSKVATAGLLRKTAETDLERERMGVFEYELQHVRSKHPTWTERRLRTSTFSGVSRYKQRMALIEASR